MWDYSYNPKIMAMSIISVFACAVSYAPYILYCPCRGVAAPAPPVSRLKARLYCSIGGVYRAGGGFNRAEQATGSKTL